jgi:hypothetical protein
MWRVLALSAVASLAGLAGGAGARQNPNSLTVGPGDQLFVTEYTANKIGWLPVG